MSKKYFKSCMHRCGFMAEHNDGRQVSLSYSPSLDTWFMRFSRLENGKRISRKVAVSTWAFYMIASIHYKIMIAEMKLVTDIKEAK